MALASLGVTAEAPRRGSHPLDAKMPVPMPVKAPQYQPLVKWEDQPESNTYLISNLPDLIMFSYMICGLLKSI